MRPVFTKQEIEILRANKNVLTCTQKQVRFTNNFKVYSLNKYSEGLTATQIFNEAGLDVGLLGKNVPKDCIMRWRKQLKNKGTLEDTRGGRKKPKSSIQKNEEERIKQLEAENAYLKAENDFLAKLRAKRAER